MIREAGHCASSVKLYFLQNSVPFCSVPSFGISSSAELGMPRNEHSETVPSLFRGIFSERNSVPNPTSSSKYTVVHGQCSGMLNLIYCKVFHLLHYKYIFLIPKACGLLNKFR